MPAKKRAKQCMYFTYILYTIIKLNSALLNRFIKRNYYLRYLNWNLKCADTTNANTEIYLGENRNPVILFFVSLKLLEAINITIKDYQNGGNVQKQEEPVLITRKHDDLSSKLAEYELSNLKIGLKVFLNSDDQEHLTESLEKGKHFTVINCSPSNHKSSIKYN